MDFGGFSNRNRTGGNERVIPIAIDGGRHPQPQPINPYPSYPPNPPPRTRQPGPNLSPYSEPKLPSGAKSTENPEFSDNELDEMEALAEILKKKRAAEANPGGKLSIRPTTTKNYHTEANENLEDTSTLRQGGGQESDNSLPSIPYPTPGMHPGTIIPGAGFVIPGQNPNLPYPIGVLHGAGPSATGGFAGVSFGAGIQSPPYPQHDNQYYPNSPGYPGL